MALKYISDEIIERVIEAYESDDDKFFADQDALTNEQAAIDALFTDESLDLLNDDEFELLWFIATVIYTSMKEVNKTMPHADPEKVIAYDEKNWEVFENAQGSFREKITSFYEEYEQEDLLAFVEDCLDTDDEDDDVDITSTGRELIFISCKTMIDVLGE